uniref:Protein-tyrosine phosphatase n=1 Tax=Strongyloides stercoralis TaxID=6248 RepID=A0A0K0E6Z6_STRER
MSDRLNTTVIHPSQINPDKINLTNIKQDGEDAEFNLTPEQIADEIYKQKEQAIRDWMREILKYPQTTDACLMEDNLPKNRFQNILLYDINRVRISSRFRGSDYYHASYVDGYDKKDRYILAQAPFDDETEIDFWRMVMSTGPCMIILLAADIDDDNGTTYKPQFWCSSRDKKNCGGISIKTLEKCIAKNWNTYSLDIYDSKGGDETKELSINLIQYKNWLNDNTVPEYILEFRAYCQLKKAETEVKKMEGPILIVCPTGAHRASFYAAMDIIMDRINQEKRVGIKTTVQIIAKQRYGSFVFFEHYCNLVETIVKHCMSSNIVDLHMLAEAQLKKQNKL